MLKLDFSIESSDERAKYINENINNQENYTKKELETISNYILYGKDKDGTSIVDRKEVQIKAKHNSYNKKEAESLDALLEKPTFDEHIIQTGEIKYKNVKPSIDRVEDKDVPGLKELWNIIDNIQYLIDVNKGKVKDENVRKLSNSELYEYQHYLIELRRQQFILKDSVKPTICRTKTNVRPSYMEAEKSIVWDEENSDFSIAPLGLYSSNPKRFEDPKNIKEKDYSYNARAKYILDFRNPTHIYELFEQYLDLERESEYDPESTCAEILKTLNFYRKITDLTKVQEKILDWKIQHKQNQWITERLREENGLTHSANYISTIYKQKICKKIAEAVILHYEYYLNREIETAWKKCSKCGKYKLKSTKEYMRRSRSSDGLSSICKKCDKEKRNSNK